MNSYKDVQAASIGLLAESVKILKGFTIDYAVVGGWSPYLRNSSPISHPGTKDVDLLFEPAATEGKLSEVISAFFDNGYLPSAKHTFQLFKVLNVSEKPMVFNIDLLHPLETIRDSEMFVDHLDLDLPENIKLKTYKIIRSIALPSSRIIFDESLYSMHKLAGVDKETIEIPLIDEVGILMTKCESIRSSKRQRDAFDIYLAIMQAKDSNYLRQRTIELRSKYEYIDLLLKGMYDYIKNESDSDFNNRIIQYVYDNEKQYLEPNPKKIIIDFLDSTIVDSL